MIKEPNPFYKRDTEIRAKRLEGISLRVLGEKFKLSHERVRQIIHHPPVEFYDRVVVVDDKKPWRLEGREYVRGQVRARDKYRCKKCRRVQKKDERAFDVHHLNGQCGKKSASYDRIEDMGGLVTLCHRCHMQLHIVRRKETKAWQQARFMKDTRMKTLRTKFVREAVRAGVSQRDIGRMFNIKQAAVSSILHAKRTTPRPTR